MSTFDMLKWDVAVHLGPLIRARATILASVPNLEDALTCRTLLQSVFIRFLIGCIPGVREFTIGSCPVQSPSLP